MGKPFHYLLLFSFLFIGIVASIMFHDDNRPTSITDEERAYVMETWERADMQMDSVIEKARQFIEQPDMESKTCPELADAVHAWMDTAEIIVRDRTFCFPFPEANKASLRLKEKVDGEYTDAKDGMIDEIIRRREQGLHNQLMYDLVSEAISRSEDAVSEASVCDRNECRWCRTKYQLTTYLLKKVGRPNKPPESATN